MKQKNVIKLMVGGFPFLLAVAVVGGLVFYYFGPSDYGMAPERKRDRSEMLIGVPISEESVGGYVTIFSEVLGEREAGDREAQRRVGKYLDSILGVRNTGYAVDRPLAGVVGMEWLVLEAEIPGGRKPDEVVMVNASFDTTSEGGGDSSGVAVMLAVARAMVADTPERTVRFVFDVREESVRERYEEVLRGEGKRIVELIEIGESVAGELMVGQAVGYEGVGAEKRRRIAGEAGVESRVAGLVEVAKQIESTVRLAGRAQK